MHMIYFYFSEPKSQPQQLHQGQHRLSNTEQNGVKDNNQPRYLPRNDTRQPRNEKPPRFQRDIQNSKSVLEGSGLPRNRGSERPSTSSGSIYDPVSLPGYVSEKTSNICTSGDKHKNVHSCDVCGSKKQEQPRYPLTKGWMNCDIFQKTEYSTTVKMSEYCLHTAE